MDEYIDKALQEIQHTIPKQHYKGPSKHVQPNYGCKVQYVEEVNERSLPADKIKYIQLYQTS